MPECCAGLLLYLSGVRSMCTKLCCVVYVVAVMLPISMGASRAAALGFESFGPAGEHVGGPADWPKGIPDVLRHQSRVYWYDVNGSERAYYDGDVEAINDLLELFSQVDLAQHDVIIRPGRP